MTFLRNTWYVAALSTELTPGQLLSRRLLDEPVVLFRNDEGEVSALYGVCPHRLAPLAMGQVVGGMVQCAYHGLGFDGSGACVHNPFGAPSKTMTVRSYPVIERNSAVWIWMGDAERADPSLLPDYSFNDPERFWVGADYLRVAASYELEIENILDLSHIQYLHPTTLGSGQVSDATYEWKQDGDTIWSNRDIHNEIMTPELSVAMGVEPDKPCNRWINVRWNAPANLAIFSGAVTVGKERTADAERPLAHLFTPETETSSHYWFTISFPKAWGPQMEEEAKRQIAYVRAPFEMEDLPMLEQQQRNVGAGGLRAMKLGWLPGDAAGARARNILYGKIAEEQGRQEDRVAA